MRHSLTLKNIIEKQFWCNKLIIVPCHISLNSNEEVLISSVVDLVKGQRPECSIKGQGPLYYWGTFTSNSKLESLDPVPILWGYALH